MVSPVRCQILCITKINGRIKATCLHPAIDTCIHKQIIGGTPVQLNLACP